MMSKPKRPGQWTRRDAGCLVKDKMDFRSIHPGVYMGTASDRYAGWMGLIYTPERYEGRVTKRARRVGDTGYTESILPVDSVAEYFEHFSVLEIDFTFYRPLLEWDGRPTDNFHLLRSYGGYLRKEDGVIVKVPRSVLALKIKKGDVFVKNEDYLSPPFFTSRIYEPAVRILGPNLKGFVFEQEYHRKKDRLPVIDLAESLDRFFGSIPEDSRYHLELRTGAYLSDDIFRVLERRGVGQVLSHWTWLPHLVAQHELSGRRFFNAGRKCVIRLITPHGMRYEESYAAAFPFDSIKEEMLSYRMLDETAELMWAAVEKGVEVDVIINNRAGGSAPLLAGMIAERFRAGGRGKRSRRDKAGMDTDNV